MAAASAAPSSSSLGFALPAAAGPSTLRRPVAAPATAVESLPTESWPSTAPRRVGSSGQDAAGLASTAAPAAIAAALVAGSARRRRLNRRSASFRAASVVMAAERESMIMRDRAGDSAKSSRGGDRPRSRDGGKGGGKGKGKGKGGRSGGRSANQQDQPTEQFTSPWTGKVYDRWAPIGLDGKGDEMFRQSGLGAARAWETPVQRQLRSALSEDDDVEEWEKYYPGTAPPELMPPEKQGKEKTRHAFRAGNFQDIFKQICIQTIVDLKVQKSDKPIWYVEACGGEGEYHVNRLKKEGEDRPPMKWPTAEIFYDALKDQDMTYMPPEIAGWVDAVKFLNQKRPEFEEGYDPKSEWKDLEADAVESLSAFMKLVEVAPWGVLGAQLLGSKQQMQSAPPPDADIALVVPMSVRRMKQGPQGSGGAEGEACRWLGIHADERFPDDVFQGIRKDLDAHFHAYEDGKMIIHAACPDFSKPRYQNRRDRALNDLAYSYQNVLAQFAESGLPKLRLFPLPSKIYAAGYAEEIPQMTFEALALAYSDLDPETQQRLMQAEAIEMCIFRATELDNFTEAFEASVPQQLPKLRKRPGEEDDEEDEEPEELHPVEKPVWLPSTTVMALRGLRRKDPVSIYEDNPPAFAAMFNFVRNFKDYLKPRVELTMADGFSRVRQIFCNGKATAPRWYQSDSKWRIQKKKNSKAHGTYSGQRGIVFADPNWDRGSEAYRTYDMINRLQKHWLSATVVVAYPLSPAIEQKARKLNMQVRQNKKLDLLTAELYVDTPDWSPDMDEEKWRGVGLLISAPPFTTLERMRAALSVMCQELMKQPGSHNMRYDVSVLK